jgi:predicted NAD-dependent protein-ADP-ribosyltransferase YbiA (DUF1768 family)
VKLFAGDKNTIRAGIIRISMQFSLRRDWNASACVDSKLLECGNVKKRLLGTQSKVVSRPRLPCPWGVCRGVGQNHLGKLLMEIRADLL